MNEELLDEGGAGALDQEGQQSQQQQRRVNRGAAEPNFQGIFPAFSTTFRSEIRWETVRLYLDISSLYLSICLGLSGETPTLLRLCLKKI